MSQLWERYRRIVFCYSSYLKKLFVLLCYYHSTMHLSFMLILVEKFSFYFVIVCGENIMKMRYGT